MEHGIASGPYVLIAIGLSLGLLSLWRSAPLKHVYLLRRRYDKRDGGRN